MPKPVEHPITSLTEFTDQVEKALGFSKGVYKGVAGAPDKVTNWYRGVGKSTSYTLIPSLYRHRAKTAADDLLILEKRMLEWFKRRSTLYQTLRSYENDAEANFEHLFFMQHNNVPTRLLDWSENPFMALYFALSSAPYDRASGGYTEDAAVWILNPTAWNQKSLSKTTWGARGVLSIGDTEASGYAPKTSEEESQLRAMRDEPVAIYGISNSPRMVAQRGVFTIFGRGTNPMERVFEDKGYPDGSLLKLYIPAANVSDLLDSVISIGFSDSAAYPDLHGLAMEIRRIFDFDV